MSTVRVSGTVLGVDIRRGTAKATGNPYVITTAKVLVGSHGVADVQMDDTTQVHKGLVVDWAVEVGVFGNSPQLRLAGAFDDTDAFAPASV